MEEEINISIKYEDDGKGKWQSVSARVEVDGDDWFFTGIQGFGETEEDAKEDLKNHLFPLLEEIKKMFN